MLKTNFKYEFGKIICLMLISTMMISAVPTSSNYVSAETDQPVYTEETDDEQIEDQEEETVETRSIKINGMGVAVNQKQIYVTVGGIYEDLPVLKKKNYDFLGWYTSSTKGKKVEEGAIVEDPVPTTLYARWRGQERIVNLDPKRAKLNTKKVSVYYDETYKPLPTPTRKGLVFMGWYTKEAGGTKIEKKNIVKLTKDTKLYAKWAPAWYMQTDKRWSKKWYRVRKENSTIGSAGCGPTTMAMVIASLKNEKVTPVTTCNWSRNHGYKAYLSGTKDGYFVKHGKKYNIKVKQTYYGDLRYTRKSKSKKYHDSAKRAVDKGNWVIVLAGHGRWTRGTGHFVLWYKNEGKYAMVRDGNSTTSARAKGSISTLQKQAKRYWIVSVPKDKRVN